MKLFCVANLSPPSMPSSAANPCFFLVQLTQLFPFNYANSIWGPVTAERKGDENTIIPARWKGKGGPSGEALSPLIAASRYKMRVSVRTCAACMWCTRQSWSCCSGIFTSVVRGPPIVSCDPLSRLLPKELYLPLAMITAHKEENLTEIGGGGSVHFSLYCSHGRSH